MAIGTAFGAPSFDLWSRVREFFTSFFGLTHRFKLIIVSGIFEAFGNPQWFSIYLKQDLGASEEDIGLVGAVKAGVRLLLFPLGGVVGYRISKKRLYMISIFLGISGYIVAFLALDWTWIIPMMIVIGCRALVMPGVQALAGEITDRSTRATVFALEATLISTVMVLRGPLQGFIAETAGLRYLYLLAAVMLAISFFIIARFFPDVKQDGNQVKSREQHSRKTGWEADIRNVFAKSEYRRNFIGLMSTGIVGRLFYYGLLPFIDIYLYEEIGWTFLFFGFYSLVTAFFSMVLRIPFGKLMDKYHMKRVFFSLGPITRGITLLVMVFVRNPYHMAVVLLVNAIVDLAFTLSLTALWYDAIPLESYPTGVAVRGVVYGFCNMFGSLLVAYMWSNVGAVSSFYTVLTTQILSGVLAFCLVRDIKEA